MNAVQNLESYMLEVAITLNYPLTTIFLLHDPPNRYSHQVQSHSATP